MKSINITRTINTATATVTYVDMNDLKVKEKTFSIPTTQKVNEKAFTKSLENDETVKVLKVSEITYESALYEMDLQTFMTYATRVGDGRVTL